MSIFENDNDITFMQTTKTWICVNGDGTHTQILHVQSIEMTSLTTGKSMWMCIILNGYRKMFKNVFSTIVVVKAYPKTP